MTQIKVHDIRGPFPVLPSHVHAYVVETPNATVIIDGTSAISSGKQVRELADSLGKPAKAVLITHGHPDHFTGLVSMADLPRYASGPTIDFSHREDESKWESGKAYLGDDFPDVRTFPDTVVLDGQTLDFDGVKFTFTELGPGESDSDGMWLVEADGVKHAFIGDTVGNDVHCFFGDGHALHWLTVLDRLEQVLDENSLIYVGHGDSPAGYEAIDRQRQYINTLLDAVRALPRESPVSQETVGKVVARMKEYLPTDDLFFLLGYELEQGIERIWKSLDGPREGNPLDEAEIRSLVTTWFRGLSDHWRLVEMLPMLATDSLKMVFPEATLTSLQDFETWYYGVNDKFFDVEHIVLSVEPTIHGQTADVRVSVVWKASTRTTPQPQSERTALLAQQAWVVERNTAGQPVIVSYIVEQLDPYQG